MNLLLLVQIIVSVLLIVSIMVQSQGTGLGKGWGGSGVSYHSRKGLEKYIFAGTIGLTILFVGLSIIGLTL